MSSRRKILSISWKVLVSFTLLLMFQECLAGVVVEQVVREREGSPSKVFLYFSEYRFRTDHREGGLTTIMDFRADRLGMIHHPPQSQFEAEPFRGGRDE